ncbi:MAG: YihY/virulence factor BrkB family protein [Rubrobacter sp.]|nr:YihY/virulence factor BrkB family protein [Rubrobacter sp.]
MKIPGMGALKRAERTGNQVEVPVAQRLGLVDFLKRTSKEIGEDHVSAFAGNLTYKWLFALFPFSVFLLSLLGIFGAPNLVGTLVEQASAVMPAAAAGFVEEQLLAISGSQAQGALTVGALVSLFFALWGVSGAFRSVMEAMNVMYEVEESRPFWKVYLVSLLLSLTTAVLLVSALVLVVAGPSIGGAVADALGLGGLFQTVWSIVQWPILLGVVLLTIALVYYFAPDVEQRFRWISPGAVVAVALWLAFSLLFSLYANNFGSYSESYGSLAGVAILMLYIYYTSFIVLVGAEMNQVIEENVPEGKNEGEKLPDAGRA